MNYVQWKRIGLTLYFLAIVPPAWADIVTYGGVYSPDQISEDGALWSATYDNGTLEMFSATGAYYSPVTGWEMWGQQNLTIPIGDGGTVTQTIIGNADVPGFYYGVGGYSVVVQTITIDGTYFHMSNGPGYSSDLITTEINGVFAPAPELSTWAMMTTGFATLGWMAYRRTQQEKQREIYLRDKYLRSAHHLLPMSS